MLKLALHPSPWSCCPKAARGSEVINWSRDAAYSCIGGGAGRSEVWVLGRFGLGPYCHRGKNCLDIWQKMGDTWLVGHQAPQWVWFVRPPSVTWSWLIDLVDPSHDPAVETTGIRASHPQRSCSQHPGWPGERAGQFDICCHDWSSTSEAQHQEQSHQGQD